MSYEKKPRVEKTCEREDCSGKFITTAKGQKYCNQECYRLAKGRRVTADLEASPLGLANPLREERRRKLGDSIPAGFIESLVKSAAAYHKPMQFWTVHDCLVGASTAMDGNMPLRIPKDWRIGSFEDLREVLDSPEFQRLCDKAELEFHYSHAHDVPCVIFTKAKKLGDIASTS